MLGADSQIPMRNSVAILLFSCCSVASLASSAAAVVQPRLAAAVGYRVHPPAMLEEASSIAAFLESNQKVATFLAIGSFFGISSAVSRMSSPAGEDIVASAVAGERNRFAELPTPSVLSILYAAIFCIAVKDQIESQVLSDWIANGAVLSELPLGPVGGGIVLAALGASELAKMRPGSPEVTRTRTRTRTRALTRTRTRTRTLGRLLRRAGRPRGRLPRCPGRRVGAAGRGAHDVAG